MALCRGHVVSGYGRDVAKSMLILIAGPYRSGTGDDPLLLERNLRRLESAACACHWGAMK